jgi:hypothetical protein
MWIMSRYGFFSIVQKDDGIHIRARERGDLYWLLSVAKVQPPPKVLETPTNDYRWRVVVDRPVLERVMATLGDSVDYPNFKAQIDRDPAQRRKPYHEVWAVLARALGAYGKKGE